MHHSDSAELLSPGLAVRHPFRGRHVQQEEMSVVQAGSYLHESKAVDTFQALYAHFTILA